MDHGQIELVSFACNSGCDASLLPFFQLNEPKPAIFFSLRDKLDFARLVKRASSLSGSGAFGAMICKSSQLPAKSTFAKDCVNVIQTSVFQQGAHDADPARSGSASGNAGLIGRYLPGNSDANHPERETSIDDLSDCPHDLDHVRSIGKLLDRCPTPAVNSRPQGGHQADVWLDDSAQATSS